MNTRPLQPSTTLAEAHGRFLDEVQAWVTGCIAHYADAPATDVHDQATFTTGWEPYIQATGDGTVLQFMVELRDKIRDHFVASSLWKHGYWTMQEAHHGTEHFELFLGALSRLAPGDAATSVQLVDAAEHMGNWVPGIPPWFDWDTGLFRSIFFGTEGVKRAPGMALNIPDHLRCVNICLLAHQVSQESRFLELSTVYARHWAQAILAEAILPLALTAHGPLYEFTPESEELYRSFVGQVSALVSPVDRAENFLVSDTINTFLKLWKFTGDNDFRRAAEKLLDVIATQLEDPDAGAAADAIRSYRTFTGNGRYDQAVLAAVEKLEPWAPQAIGLDTPPSLPHRPSGIGKRADMPLWLEDGQPRRHNPICLALTAEISRDRRLATLALDYGRTYLALAQEAFPDGRDHGCAARTVSAVARGHGRDNHAGMTTAVLKPLHELMAAG